MNTPNERSKIEASTFFYYVFGGGALAGVAITLNPIWPVVFGVIALYVAALATFCFAWSRGMFKDDESGGEERAAREDKT